MTRQIVYVFFGRARLEAEPHEASWVMTLPLVVLALFSVLLGFVGTPAWPWFQSYLEGKPVLFSGQQLLQSDVLGTMAVSAAAAALGIAAGCWFYARPGGADAQGDPLEHRFPLVFALLRRKYWVDEVYDWSVVRLTKLSAAACDWVDRWIIAGAVQLVSLLVTGFSWLSRLLDEYVVNVAFDRSCEGLGRSGRWFSRLQNGRAQRYLKIIGIGAAVLSLILIWGCHMA
jgi:NADH-quinone oxidoreductase subunit L